MVAALLSSGPAVGESRYDLVSQALRALTLPRGNSKYDPLPDLSSGRLLSDVKEDVAFARENAPAIAKSLTERVPELAGKAQKASREPARFVAGSNALTLCLPAPCSW